MLRDKRKRTPAVFGNPKITLVELTYPKDRTGSLPLCSLIFSCSKLSSENVGLSIIMAFIHLALFCAQKLVQIILFCKEVLCTSNVKFEL